MLWRLFNSIASRRLGVGLIAFIADEGDVVEEDVEERRALIVGVNVGWKEVEVWVEAVLSAILRLYGLSGIRKVVATLSRTLAGI
jgi:hypothetical protein